ncbi:MAG UNVERIFIED_CONTAM: hypothetical protein LVT10_22200 [Anaerolineae bacterium]|jgi:5,10-methylene-tetrahydrofolate dehydrogenase/methenyl tetrahydrofolate cyclohydrolase
MKQRACEHAGLVSFSHVLPQTATHQEVQKAVDAMNDDPKIHGILVQLPMPKQVNEDEILGCVRAEKDVDGFHPHNIGALAMKGREPLFTPATPTGIMILLEEMGVNLERRQCGGDRAQQHRGHAGGVALDARQRHCLAGT